MSERKARSIHTEFFPEERERWQRAVEEEQKARADNLALVTRAIEKGDEEIARIKDYYKRRIEGI